MKGMEAMDLDAGTHCGILADWHQSVNQCYICSNEIHREFMAWLGKCVRRDDVDLHGFLQPPQAPFVEQLPARCKNLHLDAQHRNRQG
jgi:hypothetical protein